MPALMLCSNSTTVSWGQSRFCNSSRVTRCPGRSSKMARSSTGCPDSLIFKMLEQFPHLGVEFEGAKADAAGKSLGDMHTEPSFRRKAVESEGATKRGNDHCPCRSNLGRSFTTKTAKVKIIILFSAIQTVGGGREAGGRQERRDKGNWAREWGRVEKGGGCVVG